MTELRHIAEAIAAGGGALILWAISLLAFPFGPCRRCGGSGLRRGSTSRRFGACKRCGGTKRVQRFGSRTVHRIAWSIRGEFFREHARRVERAAARRTAHPRDLANRDH